MQKTIFLWFCWLTMLAYSVGSSAQITSYWIDYDSVYTIGLLFSKSNYEVSIGKQYWNSHIGTNYIVSYGSYTKRGNTLWLTDSLQNYVMVFRQDDYNLYGESGLALIKGKKFGNKIFDTSNLIVYSDPSYGDEQMEKMLFLCTNWFQNPLLSGVYKFGGSSYEINENGTYSSKIGNIVISCGTWERDGNILVLFDTNLQCNFYMLIAKNNCLIENEVPYYQGNSTFTLIK